MKHVARTLELPATRKSNGGTSYVKRSRTGDDTCLHCGGRLWEYCVQESEANTQESSPGHDAAFETSASASRSKFVFGNVIFVASMTT